MCSKGNRSANGAHARRQRTCGLAVVAALSMLIAAAPMRGQPLDLVRYAPDITVPLGGVTVEGGELATDDLNGGITVFDLPNLPAGARIAAAHRLANGDLVLAFETTLTLMGAGIVEPRDLVQFDSAGGTYSLLVAGTDVDIPSGAAIDAVAVTNTGTILLSLDVSLGTFDDEDVLQIDGSNNLALFLDLSAVGVAEPLDLDALDIETGSGGEMQLYASFDGTGAVDTAPFDDEDVVVYGLTSMTWTLAYDGSAAAAQWPAAADLIALDGELPPTPTPTPTDTATVTETPTPPPTDAATGTATSTVPGATETATATLVATEDATRTPSVTPTESAATQTATATASDATATITATAPGETATATATQPDVTATATAATATPTSTGPLPPTSTATATAAETAATATAPGATATATATQPGVTGTATATTTLTATGPLPPTGTATATAVESAAATSTATATAGVPCPGDCNGSGEVTIDELIRMVNIALGNQPVSNCLAGDVDGNGTIAINEIVTAVNAAINGCP